MRIARITFALLFVIISVLTVGCAGSSSVLTPPDSPYPADIIGHVTIAKKIILDKRERDCARTLPLWARVSRAPLESFVSSLPLLTP